jgi:transcription elongation factor GreA
MCGVVFFFISQLKQDCMSEYVTQETFDKMREELHRMKAIDRPAASKAIGEAREKGDLKENAEYDAAKEAQGLHEAKVAHLEQTIMFARVIDAKDIDTSKVSILGKVNVTNTANNKTFDYQIVSEQEADLKLGKLSVTSPIGKALLGKAAGEEVEVTAPSGKFKFRINGITA